MSIAGMMTAATNFVGLVPLLFGAGETGKEILYPLVLVVFGGMLSSSRLHSFIALAELLRIRQVRRHR